MELEWTEPQTLEIRFPAGTVANLKLDFSRLETSEHLRSLAMDVFENSTGPGGSWGSYNTIRRAFSALLRFFRTVPRSADGYPDTDHATQFIQSLPTSARPNTLTVLRKLFKDDPQAPESLRRWLDVQKSVKPPRTKKRSLTTDQFIKVQTESMADLRAAVRRVESGWQRIDREDSPKEWANNYERHIDTYLNEIAQNGDIARRKRGSTKAFMSARFREYCTRLGPSDKAAANLFAMLYPLADDLAAATLALSSICGWNLSIAPQLQVTDVKTTRTPTSKTIHTVTLRKPRRGAFNTWTETYIDDGPLSKGRVISLILRLTAGVRRTFQKTGDPRTELLAYIPLTLNKKSRHSSGSPILTLNEIDDRAIVTHLNLWLEKWNELIDTLPSDFRKYFVASSHPQGHNAEENLSYVRERGLSSDLILRLSAGLESAIGISNATVLNRDTIAAEDLWNKAADRAQIESINSESTDSGPSGCIDPNNNPDTAEPCDSGFLTCITCKNAVILRRHLPSCIALRDYLAILSDTLAPGLWTPTHTNALAALNQLLEPNRFFDTALLEASRTVVDDQHLLLAKAITNNNWLI